MASEPLDRSSTKIFCCTLKMLNLVKNEGDKPHYKNQSLSLVELVGRIKNIEESSLRYDLILQDHTGSFNVSYYKKLSSSKDSMKSCLFRQNHYIKVVGSFRKVQENSSFIINSILPIYSRGEINEFWSLVLTCYLKTFPQQFSKIEDVFQSLIKFPVRTKGYTLIEIQTMLDFKISLQDLESILCQLLTSHRIKNGMDWNHYCV